MINVLYIYVVYIGINNICVAHTGGSVVNPHIKIIIQTKHEFKIPKRKSIVNAIYYK